MAVSGDNLLLFEFIKSFCYYLTLQSLSVYQLHFDAAIFNTSILLQLLILTVHKIFTK